MPYTKNLRDAFITAYPTAAGYDLQKAANIAAATSGKDLLAALNQLAGTSNRGMAHVCRLLGLPEGP